MDFELRENFTIPHPLQIVYETKSFFDFSYLLMNLPPLLSKNKHKKETVLFLPGFATDDTVTLMFRSYLNYLGLDVRGWGLGVNHGHLPRLLPKVFRLLNETYKQKKEKVILIGWSLGGTLAREAARNYPDLTRLVVTLGSPAIGGPKYTSIREIFRLNGTNLNQLEEEIDRRYEIPIEVPILSLYSTEDNIVSWQACIDTYSPKIRHINVQTTHLGLLYSYNTYLYTSQAISGELQI